MIPDLANFFYRDDMSSSSVQVAGVYHSFRAVFSAKLISGLETVWFKSYGATSEKGCLADSSISFILFVAAVNSQWADSATMHGHFVAVRLKREEMKREAPFVDSYMFF